MAQRVEHFRIAVEPGGRPFDGGKKEATVTIRTDGQSPTAVAVVEVRTKHGKTIASESLQTIARIVIDRDAARKAEFSTRPRRRR